MLPEDMLFFKESMLFPVRTFDIQAKKGENAIKYHWHVELEFITVIDGTCSISLEEQIYTMNPGESVFVNSALPHQIIAGEGGCRIQGLVFDRRLLTSKRRLYSDQEYWGKILDRDFQLTFFFSNKTDWEKIIAQRIRQIRQLCNKKSYAFELLVKAYIDDLFFQAVTHSDFSVKKGNNDEYLSRKVLWNEIRMYIEQNLQKDITVQDIAKALNSSQSSIYRCAQQYDTTISNYINSCRVRRGCELLQGSAYSITEIALEVGYSNSSYFSAIFHRYMGCTPKEYRNLVKWKQ